MIGATKQRGQAQHFAFVHRISVRTHVRKTDKEGGIDTACAK
jgi:hypothetical protein